MGLFEDIFGGPSATTPSPQSDFWYSAVPHLMSKLGVDRPPVGLAVQLTGLNAGIRYLSETIAAMPKHGIRRLENGGREKLPPKHYLSRLLRKPNLYQTSFEFFNLMMNHVFYAGQFVALIVPGRDSFAEALLPLDPNRVFRELVPATGRIVYRVSLPSGRNTTLSQDEVLHVGGFTTDGIRYQSVLEYGAAAIDAGLATELLNLRMFKNGARPSGLISHPGTMKPEKRSEFLDWWKKTYGGENQGKIALLWEGMTFQSISMTPEQVQLLAQRNFTIEDMARLLRIPPHKIGGMARSTFGNIEHQGMEVMTDTMLPWVTKVEQSFSRDVILEDDQETLFMRVNMNGHIRADFGTRMSGYTTAINASIMTPNEARAMEEWAPLPGGDEVMVPLNMGRPGGKPAETAEAPGGKKPETEEADDEEEEESSKKKETK